MCEYIWSLARELNPRPPKYDATVLAIQLLTLSLNLVASIRVSLVGTGQISNTKVKVTSNQNALTTYTTTFQDELVREA
jgi:hypothetical protein